MKVKPIFSDVSEVNYVDYLKYYGVDDVKTFTFGTKEIDVNQYKDKFNKAIKFVKQYNERDMFTLVDPDLDGYTSSAILCRMRSASKAPVTAIFHSKKQHGVDQEIVDAVPEHAFLWVPDSSVSKEFISALDEKDIVTLVIDHHPTIDEIDIDNDKHCYICNDDVPQSGSMFMYLFARYCGYTDVKLAELGALGNFGDVMPQNYMQTRSVNHLIERPQHKLLQEMIEVYGDGEENLYSNIIGWKVGPKINAVIRSTNQTLKASLFDALVTEEYDDDLIADCDCTHVTQKDTVKEIASKLVYDNSHNIIIVETPEVDDIVGLNGLIANRIQSQNNKPVLAVTYSEELGCYHGSLRSPADIKTKLNNSGLAEAQGHERAAGVKFKRGDWKAIVEAMDTEDFGGDETEVMLSCPPEKLTEELFKKFSKNVCYGGPKDIVPFWGEGLPAPVIHMKYRTNYEDIKFEGLYKSKIEFDIDGAVQYKINKDYIGRQNKVAWGIMDEVPSGKFGRTRLIQNSGPVEIEMIGTLRRTKDHYYYDVDTWEFHPQEVGDCW